MMLKGSVLSHLSCCQHGLGDAIAKALPLVSLSALSLTATSKNYVIDGQHKFAACAIIREQLQRTDRQLPKYLQVFRCKRIKPDTPLSIRQTIAGREQARAGTVLLEPLSAKVAWFLKERASAEAGVATSELLRRVYMKCGCTRSTDGSMVRVSSFLALPVSMLSESLFALLTCQREWIWNAVTVTPVFCSSPVCSCLSAQETFQKAMYALAEWAMQCGDAVVKVCERMEEKCKITPTSFKFIEQFRDPADFDQLLGEMLASPSPNVSNLKTLAKGILQRRNWIWVLTHPDLGEEYIHPDRSVFLHPVLA